ncbi:MAG: biotin/lipoyl-containing protein [Bacillota bacterium]|nr:biotin/lipoyl-containing protein [Bacillota bacterium]
MKKFKFTINGNQYETEIASVDENNAEVIVNGVKYNVEVQMSAQISKTPKLVRSVSVPSTDVHPAVAKTRNPSAPKGGGNIQSPLPGTILDIMVKVGDTVKIGQRLLVLEAMKMENNIESDKAGTVLSIAKQKGDSVMEGDLLIVIG